MPLFSRPLPPHAPCDAFRAFADQPFSLFLDSADRTHPSSRYSYILFAPITTVTSQLDTQPPQAIPLSPDPFSRAQAALQAAQLPKHTHPDLPPFQGGLAGLLGYDLGRLYEHIDSQAPPCMTMPDMALGLYTRLLAYDHEQGKQWALIHTDNTHTADAEFDRLMTRLSPALSAQPSPPHTSPPLTWTAECTQDSYESKVRQVIDHILAGDIFQANLSHQFRAQRPDDFSPYDHYLHLRRCNPAPFSAYMSLPHDNAILSASPERFVSADPHGTVTTQPIKGTQARNLTHAHADTQAAQSLLTSKKDRAENVMITDLLRNDLSKTCTADSIDVPKLCALESFADVHHLVSTVTGQLAPKHTPLDLLKGCFPGGSITGAPKIRAMHIIDTLESTRRHAYCGSLAMIGPDGFMDSSILIRTVLCDASSLRFNVGGGVTALSDPAQEYQETLDKARRIFASFQGEDQ